MLSPNAQRFYTLENGDDMATNGLTTFPSKG